MPVVEERLRVDKRDVVTDHVVLRKTVEQRDAFVEVLRRTHDVSVERVPVNRVVAEAPAIREEGDVVIVPVIEEQAVVQTRLVLVEEIRIRRTAHAHAEHQKVPLRREMVEITRPPIPQPSSESHPMSISEQTSSTMPSAAGAMPEGGTAAHVVAMYDTYAEARAARDQLTAAGIAGTDMDLLDRNAQANDASFSYEHTNEGFWGAIKRLFMPEEDVQGYAEGLQRGHAVLVVRPRGENYDHVIQVLETTNPVDIDAREQEWRSGGWTPRTGTAAVGAMGAVGAGETVADRSTADTLSAKPAATTGGRTEEVIPVIEEQIRIGKRDVSRGSVRVRSYVVERPVQEQVHLREERVDVERHAVDRPLGTETDPFRERVIEVTATGEEAVVSKEVRVVEEVEIRKEATERVEVVNDTVRRTEVVVEGDDPERDSPAPAEAGRWNPSE